MTDTLAPELWRLPDEELTAVLLAREEKLRTSYAEVLAVIGEVEQRGLGKGLGYKDTAALLRESLRISAREAHIRIAQAAATMPSSSLTGLPQPPGKPWRRETSTANSSSHHHDLPGLPRGHHTRVARPGRSHAAGAGAPGGTRGHAHRRQAPDRLLGPGNHGPAGPPATQRPLSLKR